MKKTVVYALILSAVSVGAGLVAGGTLERAKIKKHLDAIRPHQPFPQETRRQSQGSGPKEIFQRLAKELNLDEGQKQEFKNILERAREDISSITRDSRERLLIIRKESDERILGILTPEQQEKFKKFAAEAQRNHPQAMRKFGQMQEGDLPPPPAPPEGEEPPAPPESF